VIANEILALGPPPSTRSRALQLLAEIAYGENFAEAEQRLDEALACSGRDPMRRAQLELNLAFTGLAMSDLARSLPHARLAESLAAGLGDPGLEAEATGIRVFIETLLSDRLDREALSRSLRNEERAREAPIQIRPSQNAGLLDMLFGRLDDALATFLDLRGRILESGEEHELPFVLNLLGFIELFRGDTNAASEYINDAARTSTAIGSTTLYAFARAIGAIRGAFVGEDENVTSTALAALEVFERSGWRTGSLYAVKAISFHALSRGDWRTVLKTASPISAVMGDGWAFGGTSFIAGDIVEALLAEGDLVAAERIAEGAIAGGLAVDAPWALVVGFRGRALIESARGRPQAALAAIGRAEAECSRLPIPFELGRTYLAKGQILRRQRQKRSAREALRSARTLFDRLQMPLWVERASVEIGRVGLRTSNPATLTKSEQTVATLAAAGLTNREIAARAFLSPRSVEDVLSRVYAKLGIRSRAQLGAWVARQ
jgi:DNA-binding CsgD family transcriptional regulator